MTLARRYLPDLDARGARLWMGNRPTTPDSIPVIGRSPRRPMYSTRLGTGIWA
jgi:D-amino-acid dehydrogenase